MVNYTENRQVLHKQTSKATMQMLTTSTCCLRALLRKIIAPVEIDSCLWSWQNVDGLFVFCCCCRRLRLRLCRRVGSRLSNCCRYHFMALPSSVLLEYQLCVWYSLGIELIIVRHLRDLSFWRKGTFFFFLLYHTTY